VKKSVAISILLILFCSLFPLDINGAENNFQVESYYVDITIKNDRTYLVTETINVYGNKVGEDFVRTIPLLNEHERLYIDNVVIDGENYTTNETDEAFIIKIDGGNADESMRKKYIISYTIKQYKDLYKDKDIVNLDILESAWNLDINSAVVKIHLPDTNNLTSYSVQIGNNNVQKSNVYKYMSNNIINIKTKRYISASDKLKIFMTFKEGTFKKATSQAFDYVINNAETTMLFNTDCIANYNSSIQIKKNNNEANIANIYILKQDINGNITLIQDILVKSTDDSKSTSYDILSTKDYYIVKLDIMDLKVNDSLEVELSYQANLPIHYADNHDYVNLSTPFFDTITNRSSLIIYQNSPLYFIEHTSNINFYDELDSMKNTITSNIDQDFNISFESSNILMPNEVASIQLNYVKSKLYVRIPINIKFLFIVCLSIIIILVLLLFIGKNKKTRKNASENSLELLNKLNPLKIKYYLKATFSSQDITYLIIYWASKGYLKIKKINNQYSMIKIKELDYDSKEYEKYIFNYIFQHDEKGVVHFEQLDGIFYTKAIKTTKIFEMKNKKNGRLFERKSQIISYGIFLFGIIMSIIFLMYTFKYLDRNIIYSFIYVLIYLIIPIFFNIYLNNKIKHNIGNNYYRNIILSLILIMILFIYIFLYFKGQFNIYSTYIFASIGMINIIIAPFIKRFSEVCITQKENIIELGNYFNSEESKELLKQNSDYCNQILPYIFVLDEFITDNETIHEYFNYQPDWFEIQEEYTPEKLMLLWNKLNFYLKESTIANEILNTSFVKMSSGNNYY